ncbi:hypothetical protein [Endozoicomonas sp. ALC066]|uniref:hypothetical protein n=1 Tax=Endozoicomonas sp. ALC066 TaxID=3403078 RepID=UPI003BB646A6
MTTANTLNAKHVSKKMFVQAGSGSKTTRLDVNTCKTDLHKFLVLTERDDNPGARVTATITDCLNHLQKHQIWQSEDPRYPVLYFDPENNHVARIEPETCESGSVIDAHWYSLPRDFSDKLGLGDYEYSDTGNEAGIFSS